MADPKTETKTSTKRKRKPMPYELLGVETVKSLLARADKLPADTVVYVRVQTPTNVRKDKPLRRDFEKGVHAALEAGGTSVELYNDLPMCVGQIGETFRFKAAVKEEVIRKVTVQKV